MRRPPLPVPRHAWIASGTAAIFLFALPGSRAEDPRPRGRPDTLLVLSLERAYDLALANNQAIRHAWIELRTAQLEPWSALTRLGPQVAGSLNYELIRERRFNDGGAFIAPLAATADTAPSLPATGLQSGVSRVASDPTPGVAGTVIPDFDGTHNYTRRASIFIQQPLLDLTVFPAWRFGKLSAATAQLRRQYTIRETLFGVARAYFAVLKAQKIAAVNRETVQLAEQQMTVAESRFSMGDVARADVSRAQAVVQAGRRTLIESEGRIELHRNTLANLLDLPWGRPFAVMEPAETPARRSSFPDLLSGALERREDFRASALGIDQGVERRKEIVASYAPRVVAQAERDWTNVTTNTSNLEGQGIWSAVVAVQVPFFTGGQREIDLRKAGYALEQARLEHEQLANSIQTELQQAWVEVRTLGETISALQAEVEATDRAYEDSNQDYRSGTATSVDLASALRERNNARAMLAGTRYDYQVALRNLQRAEGVFQSDRVRQARLE